MARARNIKPAFFTDDELAELPALTRLLFIGLWTVADRNGRLDDRPAKIKAEVLPYDNCKIDAMLAALAAARFITRYEVAGKRYIEIRSFSKHQNPHVREPESTIPAPCKPGASTVPAPDEASPKPEPARLREDSGFPITDSGFQREDSGAGDFPETRLSLPRNFSLPDGWRQEAERLRPEWSGDETLRVFFGFRDHYASTGGKRTDWFPAWLKWVRNERSTPASAPSKREPTLAEKRAANMDVICGRSGNGRDIEGAATRVDSPAVRSLPGDLRQPGDDDVGGRQPVRVAGGVG